MKDLVAVGFIEVANFYPGEIEYYPDKNMPSIYRFAPARRHPVKVPGSRGEIENPRCLVCLPSSVSSALQAHEFQHVALHERDIDEVIPPVRQYLPTDNEVTANH